MRLPRLPGPSWWLCLLVLASLAGYAALRFELVTGISHFLPEGTDRELAPLSRELAESELTRTLIITVGADSPQAAVDAAADLASHLDAGHDELAWVRSGPPQGLEEAFHALFFPRRMAFLAEHPQDGELEALLSDAGLRARLAELEARLARPGLGSLTRNLAPQDPLLAFEHHLERVKGLQQGALGVHRGHFLVTDDDGRSHGVVFLATKGSPFDASRQGPLLEWLDHQLEQLQTRHDHALSLEMSAVHRFAVASERSIRADITRISIVSSIGLVLLFLGVLRRPRYLVLAFLPLAGGFVAALAVSLAVFGAVHGLTLAFGASLLGVCIDYPVHLFNHHALDPERAGPGATVQRIWTGLALGAATTVAGFSGLAWTTLPGIREIALFAAVGVAASLLVTRYLVAPLLPHAPPPVAVQQRAAAALARLLAAMQRKPAWLAVLPLAALVVCAAGLPRVHWVDDVSALNELDKDLLAEDERVRKRVSRMESGQLVLALGDDTEAALQNNDAAARVLAQARADGLVDSYRSLHDLLWSAATQQQNLDAVYKNDPTLPDRLDAALRDSGFTPAAFAPFRQALAGEVPQPLRFEALSADPALASMVAPFRVELDGRVAVLTLLHGLHDTDALDARLEPLDGVHLFDQRAFLERTYRSVRARSLELIAVGLIAVLAMLLLRYRSPRIAIAAFAPALLAAATTLGVLGLLGLPVHILHVVSLLLVMSIGVDYGVFLAESRTHGRAALAATLLSIVMACASTVLAFGLLAMSSMPALRAIGLSVGIGVMASLVLAPAALVLAGAAKR